jgi:hypothetical protein
MLKRAVHIVTIGLYRAEIHRTITVCCFAWVFLAWRTFEKRALRRVIRRKGEEVTGEWGEMHTPYSVIRILKTR